MKTEPTKRNIGTVCGLMLGHLLIICLFPLICNKETNAQECTLALQLNDPYIRSDYETVVEYGRKTQVGLSVEAMYENIQSTSYNDELPMLSAHTGNRILDPISMECITCHDGTLASSVHYKVKTAEQAQTRSLGNIAGSHPVGMDYTRYGNNREYVPHYSLPGNMVLMDGRIGCISCHDMLSKNKAYLAVELSNSELCFSCHRK